MYKAGAKIVSKSYDIIETIITAINAANVRTIENDVICRIACGDNDANKAAVTSWHHQPWHFRPLKMK